MSISSAPAFPLHPFWDFSLRTYRGAVPAACLALQDSYGLDANMLLYAVWRGTQSREPLDPERITLFLEAVRSWNQAVVQPLRQARRAVRSTPAGLNSDLVKHLHDSILEVEIATEHAEQLLIASAGEQHFKLFGNQSSGSRQAAADNLQTYFRATETPLDGAVLVATETLLNAVFGPEAPQT